MYADLQRVTYKRYPPVLAVPNIFPEAWRAPYGPMLNDTQFLARLEVLDPAASLCRIAETQPRRYVWQAPKGPIKEVPSTTSGS